MNSRIKTSVIIGIVLANLVLANFALAQTPPTPPATNVTIDKTDLDLANQSIDGCQKLKDKVFNVYNQQLKAVWYAPQNLKLNTKGCYIVSVTFQDNNNIDISGQNAFFQPLQYQNIQKAIGLGKGISSKDVTAAQLQDLKDQTSANPISMAIGWAISSLFTVVTFFVSFLTTLAGGIFDTAVRSSISVTTMPTIVTTGWAIMRDFANMFFILILIVMALATILQMGEEYNYKHLLPKVVMAALLVNFSQVIAVELIRFVNFIASIFATNGLHDIFTFVINFVRPDDVLSFTNGGWMSALLQGITKLVFSLVSLSAFLALAGMFVVRIVGLYVLVILSPMAYLLNILPATEHFAKEWWQNFIKYLIWAPVALFFVNLTFLLSKGMGGIADGNESAFKYVILMAFMWASVLVAEHAGMVGSQAIVHGAEKFSKGIGLGAGHIAGGYVTRKYNELTTKLLESHDGKEVGQTRKILFAAFNPVAAYKGSQQRAKELTHMSEEEAHAGGREVMEQYYTGSSLRHPLGWLTLGYMGKPELKIPYRQFVARKEEDTFLKDYGNMKKETLMRAAVTAEKLGGPEGEARRRAIIKAAASGGYLDDVLRMKHFANKYADQDGTTYSAEVLNRFMYGYLGEGEQSKRFMAEDMEELGKKVKHFEYLGHAYYDPAKNEWKRGMEKVGQDTFVRGGEEVTIDKMGQGADRNDPTTFNHQASYAASEFAKLGGRDRVNIAPHNITSIRSRLAAGTNDFANPKEELGEDMYYKDDGHIDISQQLILEKMDADVAREAQHAQERVKRRVLTDEYDKTTKEVVIKDIGEFNKIQALYGANTEYVVGMYAKEQGIDPRQHLEQASKGKNENYTIKFRYVDPSGTPHQGEFKYDPAVGGSRTYTPPGAIPVP